MLSGGGNIAGGVEARNGMTPLVDHLSPNVCQQADRRATSRMQLDAVERWLFDGPEAAIGVPCGFRGREFPLVFATVKIIVRASEPGPPMTLGSAAAAGVRLIGLVLGLPAPGRA
jgi:hypothetical protein